jgi:hypothetical protein
MKKTSNPSTMAAMDPMAALVVFVVLAAVFFCFCCVVASSLADCRRVETIMTI